MSTLARPMRRKKLSPWIVCGVPAAVLVLGMVFDTKIVRMDGKSDASTADFSPDTFGATQFPKIQALVEQKAVDAATLVSALQADKDAAGAKYGVPGSIGPEISVKFTGTVGQGRSGMYFVTIPGVPDEIRVRVQTGPAINGTDIRDSTGTVSFGQFKNQIEFQDAGSALNREMKKDVLAKVDTSALTGKTISVVGVFQLVNPKSWLVTPVALEVK